MSSMMCGMLLGAGVVSKKTYVDDVFSTFLYKGTNGANTVNTGLDMSGEGGLLWVKARSNRSHQLFDTVRGVNKRINTDTNSAEDNDSNINQTFTSTGFTFNNTYTDLNDNNVNYSSWNFRKAPGFFDIVTYTGNGTQQRNISHSLGCEPGLILIKRTDSTGNWWVYHRDLGDTDSNYSKAIKLNDTGAKFDDYKIGNRSKNTSTTFMVGNDPQVNGDGGTYVAYVFAGGESTNALARSVDFDASGDYLTIPDSADWTLGNTFTIEFWVYLNSGAIAANGHDAIVTQGNSGNSNGWWITVRGSDDAGSGNLHFKDQDTSNYQFNSADKSIFEGQWTHCALVCNSGTSQWYVNGTASGATGTINLSTDVGNAFGIGTIYSNTNTYLLDGKISNLRVVKGTAVYTSSFKPPTEPLTNITNTKLLCCNNSSTTGSTVSPGTITAHGDPTASTDSPFDDPAGFVFGDAEDQNVIKNGSMKLDSNGKTTVNLGFEPQWLMWKKTSGTGGWTIYDAMRGVITGSGDQFLNADSSNAESTTNNDVLIFTPTGFEVNLSFHSDSEWIFTAIRRSDGYVGKPPELGTDVFNVTAADTTLPAFNANFAVDLAIYKTKNQSADWYTTSRLTAHKNLKTNASDAEVDGGGTTWFAYNDGFSASDGFSSNRIGWLWKRHAGFDVVTYKGDDVAGRQIRHNLSKVPEMIWVKCRSNTQNWDVYHKGLNGGTTPWNYVTQLNSTNANSATDDWNDTAPTSTAFSVGTDGNVNESPFHYVAMLFASVDGMSKVGYYSGQATELTITTGFAPRFLILKRINGADNWWVFDTTRGWVSGNNSKLLQLDSSAAESTQDFGAPTSTGFTLVGDSTRINAAGNDYIYYCHA